MEETFRKAANEAANELLNEVCIQSLNFNYRISRLFII